MTEEELLQEFLEASHIDKEDIAFYGRMTSITNGSKTYTGIEGLYVELKAPPNPFGIVPQLTYFHHPKLER
jgi:hypothetical protein